MNNNGSKKAHIKIENRDFFLLRKKIVKRLEKDSKCLSQVGGKWRKVYIGELESLLRLVQIKTVTEVTILRDAEYCRPA